MDEPLKKRISSTKSTFFEDERGRLAFGLEKVKRVTNNRLLVTLFLCACGSYRYFIFALRGAFRKARVYRPEPFFVRLRRYKNRKAAAKLPFLPPRLRAAPRGTRGRFPLRCCRSYPLCRFPPQRFSQLSMYQRHLHLLCSKSTHRRCICSYISATYEKRPAGSTGLASGRRSRRWTRRPGG